MAHKPVILVLKVVQHLDSLPYRVTLDRFVSHTHECEPCAEEFDAGEPDCSGYCTEGHRLFHAVSESIDRQHTASVWN